MGRGRAKAKQTKVARKLKYSSGGTDLSRLANELGVPDSDDDVDVGDEHAADDTDDTVESDPYAPDDSDEGGDDLASRYADYADGSPNGSPNGTGRD